MNKEDKKRLLREYKQRQAAEFESSLPMSRKLFEELFNFLDEESEEWECQHDFTLTVKFLQQNHCDVDAVLDWLVENGAGCDCEVLLNVEELFED